MVCKYYSDYDARTQKKRNSLVTLRLEKTVSSVTAPKSSAAPRPKSVTVKHHYLHRDHLGSITAVTDETDGSIVERYSYDAWGKRRIAETWQASDITTTLNYRGYTGHEHLDDVGIIHMNGRLYSPKLGRMLSPDPIIGIAMCLIIR